MRRVIITIGTMSGPAVLRDTPTADRIWQQLPIHSRAKRRGDVVSIETNVETGREADATTTIASGEIGFWVEEDCVLAGAAQGSRQTRLMQPVNIWADAEDATDFSAAANGEPASITRES